MSLYLFKPHVIGPEDNITTPDIVIDRVFVDGKLRPVSALTSNPYQQVEEGETGCPAYVITALGGGALIGPAVVLGSGSICLARFAWRLNNLDRHIGDVTLNGMALSSVRLPEDIISQAGGKDDTLPRGYQLVAAASKEDSTALLEDPVRGRRLEHRVTLLPVTEDRWGDQRPKPRYSVGPMTKEVTHYI